MQVISDVSLFLISVLGRAQQAKTRRNRNGTFVAIDFCDLLYLHRFVAIFEFGVVAISLFFASERSMREY